MKKEAARQLAEIKTDMEMMNVLSESFLNSNEADPEVQNYQARKAFKVLFDKTQRIENTLTDVLEELKGVEK